MSGQLICTAGLGQGITLVLGESIINLMLKGMLNPEFCMHISSQVGEQPLTIESFSLLRLKAASLT